jgi:eukaryotic-like serine/threonine-protein kinase
MGTTRNKLFGLFAIGKKKISEEELLVLLDQHPEAARADLGSVLQASGTLSQEEYETLRTLVRNAENKLSDDEDSASETLATFAKQAQAEKFMDTFDNQTVLADDMSTVAMSQGAEASLLSNTAIKETGKPADATIAGDLPSFVSAETVRGQDETIPADPWNELNGDQPVPAVQEHKGRYHELKPFGAGGMGQIWLVHDQHLGREIALKQLLPGALGGMSYTRTAEGAPTASVLTVPLIARFLQEARITGQLEHPSIIPVYELGFREDGSLYYTMKLVRGDTLQDKVDKAASLKDRLNLLTHFLDLCHAMAYAHSRGVIHRDLKPLNVMVGSFGETVVIDWGIAKVRGSQDVNVQDLKEHVDAVGVGGTQAAAKTMHGQAMGSPYYMPPEQAAGEIDRIDESSDVYALGAILYIILTGSPPYKGMGGREFLEKVKTFPPKPIKNIEKDVPPELIAVCERAMERDPKDRYPTAKELAEEIQRYISGGLVRAYSYSIKDVLLHFIKKHKAVLSTAAIGVVVLAIVGVISVQNIVEARNEAERQAVEAERQANIASEQRGIALERRDEARHSWYRANIALSQANLDEEHIQASRELLFDCPPEYRGWEWGRLLYASNADQMTLPYGSRFVAYAAEGKQLITGSNGGRVLLYDLQNGEVLHTFAEEAGNEYALAHSADGSRLALNGNDGLTVWDTATQKLLLRFEETKKVPTRSVAMSDDGQWVVALQADRKARVWKVGEEVPRFDIAVSQAKGFQVRFDHGGESLLVARREFGAEGWLPPMLERYEMSTGTRTGQQEFSSEIVIYATAISADGAHMVLGTNAGMQLWDWPAFKLSKQYKMPIQGSDSVAFSFDSRHVAVGGANGALFLIDVATGEVQRDDRAHEGQIRALAFSHHDRWLATVSYDRVVRLWASSDLHPLKTLKGHNSAIFSMAFAPDDKQLATASYGNAAKLWNLESEPELLRVTRAAFHPKTERLAGTAKEAPDSILIWDAKLGHRLSTLATGADPVDNLEFSPNGTRLAALSGETLRAWDLESEAALWEVALSGEGNELRFGGEQWVGVRAGAALHLINAATGELTQSIENVTSYAFDAQGARLATCINTKTGDTLTHTIALTNLADAAFLGSFTIETGWTSSTRLAATLHFAPNGKTLYAGAWYSNEQPGEIHLWDLATQQQGPTLEAHPQLPLSLDFSPDGAHWASGGRDGSIILWDAETNTPLHTHTLEGHTDRIHSLAFSPDGARLASASRDGTFKLWDTAQGMEVLTVQQSARTATGVVVPERALFGAQGQQLMTLTDPIQPPLLLQAFDIDTNPDLDQKAVEAYKRAYWK